LKWDYRQSKFIQSALLSRKKGKGYAPKIFQDPGLLNLNPGYCPGSGVCDNQVGLKPAGFSISRLSNNAPI
jgi:hypothetical protein